MASVGGAPPTLSTVYPPRFRPVSAIFQKRSDGSRAAPPTRRHGVYPPPDLIETPSAIV